MKLTPNLLRWILRIGGLIAAVFALTSDVILGNPIILNLSQVVLFFAGLILIAASFTVPDDLAGRGEPLRTRIGRGYRAAAMIFTNSALVFVVLNGLVWAGFQITDRAGLTTPVRAIGGNAALVRLPLARLAYQIAGRAAERPIRYEVTDAHRTVYPDMNDAEIEELLAETRGMVQIYEPFTQFRPEPIRSTYVNVSEDGYRLVADQQAWPPPDEAISIWVFGGSTIFGYGVPDDDTIASYLQGALQTNCDDPIAVYNFGRHYYYSDQELILYMTLLKDHPAPDMVIFIDGLNDHLESPVATAFLESVMADLDAVPPDFDTQRHLTPQESVDNWLGNKRLVETLSAAHGTETLFVWQPIPRWNYDLRYHLFLGGGSGNSDEPRIITNPGSSYGLLDALRQADDPALGENFLWLADIQLGIEEPLYVDQNHYTAAFSETIAGDIAATIDAGYSLCDS